MIFRLRHLLVGQRTQTVNALRGHLAEFGLITGKGRENVDKLRSALNRDEEAADLPASVRQMAQLCFDQIDDLSRRIAEIDAQIAAASRHSRFSSAAATDAGSWTHHCDGSGGFRSADGELPAGTRLLGLAGRGASTAFKRWQAEAWPDKQVRAARHPAPADHRGHGGDLWRQGSTSSGKLMARAHPRPQTKDAGRHRAGEQDGAHALGHDLKGRRKGLTHGRIRSYHASSATVR